MTKEHGFWVERESVYRGKLVANDHTVKGYRVFNENMDFEGILDLREHALWYVKKDSLQQIFILEDKDGQEHEIELGL